MSGIETRARAVIVVCNKRFLVRSTGASECRHGITLYWSSSSLEKKVAIFVATGAWERVKLRCAVVLRSQRTGRIFLDGNSVGAGWTFHLDRGFIRRITTPDPGGSASCALLNHLVIHLTQPNGKKGKVQNFKVKRLTKVTKGQTLNVKRHRCELTYTYRSCDFETHALLQLL